MASQAEQHCQMAPQAVQLCVQSLCPPSSPPSACSLQERQSALGRFVRRALLAKTAACSAGWTVYACDLCL